MIQGWQSPAPCTALVTPCPIYSCGTSCLQLTLTAGLQDTAFVANIQLWQSGCNTCWAARMMAHMQQLGLQDKLDSQQPICSQRLVINSIEVAMDTTLAAAWSSYQQHPSGSLDHPTVRAAPCSAMPSTFSTSTAAQPGTTFTITSQHRHGSR